MKEAGLGLGEYWGLPFGNDSQFAIGNGPVEIVDYPLKMVIFYSYVSLPEGIVTHESGIPINQPPEGYGMARLEVILLLEPVQALRTCHAIHGILVVLVVFGAPGLTPHQYAHICTCVCI